MSGGDGFLISEDRDDPSQADKADLTKVAALLLDAETMKENHLVGSLRLTKDISWGILLRLYVSSNADESVAISDLAVELAQTPTIITRYVNLLLQKELIQTEQREACDQTGSLALTEHAHAKLSRALADFHTRINESRMFA